jgi:hypothetical protein
VRGFAAIIKSFKFRSDVRSVEPPKARLRVEAASQASSGRHSTSKRGWSCIRLLLQALAADGMRRPQWLKSARSDGAIANQEPISGLARLCSRPAPPHCPLLKCESGRLSGGNGAQPKVRFWASTQLPLPNRRGLHEWVPSVGFRPLAALRKPSPTGAALPCQLLTAPIIPTAAGRDSFLNDGLGLA